MAYIYAYAPDEDDCSTIGLVGALLDEDAQFDLKAGEFGELTFSHPVDPYGKWEALVNGAILKTMIPMRLCPELKLVNGSYQYISTVDKYVVSSTATKAQRYIYSGNGLTKKGKKQNGKKKKLLSIGKVVTVTGVADASDNTSRYKVKLGKVSGWMERQGLTVQQQNIPVEQDEGGLEATEPSYAVRQQLFRIYEVNPQTSGSDGGSVQVKARRIVYDLLGNVSTYKYNDLLTCQTACDGILNNTIMSHEFSVYTDISDQHAGFSALNKNPIAALVDPEEGVTGRWGAEIVSDDYEIYVLHRAGLDRGVSIEYGKNLIGVDVSEDVSSLATAIRPVGEDINGNPLYVNGEIKNGVHVYNGSEPLPSGYHFYIDEEGTLNGTVIVRDTYDADSLPRLYVENVSDAHVEKGKNGVTTAVARRMMVARAVELFSDGCDAAEINMKVDFVLLGDTEEYRQFKHLEPLFVYDTVHIHDRRIGQRSDIDLTSITWDVRSESVIGAEFGSLKDMTASISGWQISSVDGGKIMPGTVGAGQLGDSTISARAIQAKSVTAEAMDAEKFTADTAIVKSLNARSIEAQTAAIQTIAAQSITTNELDAAYADIFSLIAQQISGTTVQADDLEAAIANLVSVTGTSAKFEIEDVQHLIGKVIQATVLTSGLARIENLYVTQANLMNATLDRLTLLAADGETYYDVSVGTDGNLIATERDPSSVDTSTGTTSDGRNVLDASEMESDTGMDVPDLDGLTAMLAEDGLLWVYTQGLSTGKLRATEAFIGSGRIDSLQTTAVEAVGNSMTFSANQVIQLLVGVKDQIRTWFTFGDDGLRTRKMNADGTPASPWSTLVSNDGFYIDHDEVVGMHVGAFYKENAIFRCLQVTKDLTNETNTAIRVRPTSKGGWVWVD